MWTVIPVLIWGPRGGGAVGRCALGCIINRGIGVVAAVDRVRSDFIVAVKLTEGDAKQPPDRD